MAEKPIKFPLPADLPENWDAGQIVAPDGIAVGLTEQHGYNYLMAAVNRAQRGVNEVNEAFETVSGKRTCRFVVGTSTAGWTEADCDYLCDGTDDQVEIQQAVDALPEGGGEIVLLSGTYQLSSSVNIKEQIGAVSIRGEPGSTILHGGGLSIRNTQSAHSCFVEGVSFDNGSYAISSLNTSLSVKNCSFVNTGVHFQQSLNGWPCSFFCCGNRFLQNEPISEQGGVIEVLQIIYGMTQPLKCCVISNNIIEMTAASTSRDTIVGMSSSGSDEGMYTFSDNTILCGVKCKVMIRESVAITGNVFYNCDLTSYRGGTVTGNRFFDCGILAEAVLPGGSSANNCISIAGNSLVNGTISATGNVDITGNIVDAGDAVNTFAIRLYKSNYDAGVTMDDQFPAVVGNYIVGGSYGILLEEAVLSNKDCFYAMVNSNRIYGSQTPIKIGKYWSGCMITDNLFITGAIEDDGQNNIIRFNSDDASGGSGGSTAGVSSFNRRTGAVMPQANDYSAADVGAVASTSAQAIQAVTQAEYDALTTKNPTTLYLIKE